MPVRFRRSPRALLAAAAVLATLPTASLAHHAMGGATPRSFLDGLLSGFAHPVIELPHLAAILLAGAVAARVGRPAWIACFVIGSFLGTAALALDLPWSPGERLVEGTLLLLAAASLLRGPITGPTGALILLAVGGVHGAAFAESVAGAEPTPIVAYLVGLAIAELALAGMAAIATSKLLPAREPRTG
jgi:urease accessory protein